MSTDFKKIPRPDGNGSLTLNIGNTTTTGESRSIVGYVGGSVNFYGANQDALERLPCAEGAAFNSTRLEHERLCQDGTRAEFLGLIMDWSTNSQSKHIFWLSGRAGTGKSTIARTVAHKLSNTGQLGASFFFSRGGGDLSSASKFLTTLAFDLAKRLHGATEHIRNAIQDHPDIAQRTKREQWKHLILEPLSQIDTGLQTPTVLVFVVDALDECENMDDVRLILQLFAESKDAGAFQLRLFVTSRPELPITSKFKGMDGSIHQDISLHTMFELESRRDVSTFLESELRLIGERYDLPLDWVSKSDFEKLVQKAGGLFIYATTACLFIGDDNWVPDERLALLLTDDEPNSQTDELDKMYMQILYKSIIGTSKDREKLQLLERFRRVVGCVIVLFEPLTTEDLSKLLRIRKEHVKATVSPLGSILNVSYVEQGPLRPLHLSFRDFLLDKRRCVDELLWIDRGNTHTNLAIDCLELMSCHLTKDICKLRLPGIRAEEIKLERVKQCIPAEVQYACRYWVRHLQGSGLSNSLLETVHSFLKQHLLHWFEVLSLLGCVPDGVLMMSELHSSLQVGKNPDLYALVHDAMRFIMYHRSMIERAPLQIYSSALIFAPETSTTRELFKQQIPDWICQQPKVPTTWGVMRQTLESGPGRVDTVTFSSDGRRLASASHAVYIWDAATGARLQTLKRRAKGTGPVKTVAFSPDGRQLASGSTDRTVILWDTATGAELHTLKGHRDVVGVVTFSPDGKRLASGSRDLTVRLWDTATGASIRTLSACAKPRTLVNDVCFSPDGKLLVSASDVVRLWDAAETTELLTSRHHTKMASSIAFSPDSKQLAVAWEDQVRLWDTQTRAELRAFEGHTQMIHAVAFSPDGKKLASASSDRTARLWDTATGAELQMFEVHVDFNRLLVNRVAVVAFSPDGKQLAAAPYDRTAKLWDVATGAELHILAGHTDFITSIVFSPDGKQLASASHDGVVKLWDTAIAAASQTLECHKDLVNGMAISPDGKLVASASRDGTVKLWDTTTGTALRTLTSHTNFARTVIFSPDGKQLAVTAALNGTVQLWNTATGEKLHRLTGDRDSVNTVTFSTDGKQLAAAVHNGTVQLWNTATGEELHKLISDVDSINAVAFSPDGKRLASASNNREVFIWDTETGEMLQILEGNEQIRKLSFSRKGPYLETDRGLISLQRHPANEIPLQPQPLEAIYVNGDWIARDAHNLLWLPPEYRAKRWAVQGDLLSIGCASGRVILIRFNPSCLLE